MAGTTRLKLYNGALLLCGERFLASLTEEREPRRLLDYVWDKDGIRYCLEQGEWQFAMRSQQIEYDPSTEPPFGYLRAFNKPDDWIATHAVCQDAYFREPLRKYSDEVDVWYADLDTIYVKFVSDDNGYGNNLGGWPQSFCDYVEAYFASQIILKVTSDKQKIQFLLGQPGKIDGGELGRQLKVAKSRAAMTKGSQTPVQGAWNKARSGGTGGPMGDGGTTGSLTG